MPGSDVGSVQCVKVRFPDEGLILPKAVRHRPGSRVDGTTRGPETINGEACYVSTFEATGFPADDWQRLRRVLEATYRPMDMIVEDTERQRYVARMYMPVDGLHGRAAQMLYPLMDAFDGIWWHYEGWEAFLAGRIKADQNEDAVVLGIRTALESGGLPAEFEVCSLTPEEQARVEALQRL